MAELWVLKDRWGWNQGASKSVHWLYCHCSPFPQATHLVHCRPGRQSEDYWSRGEQSAACWGHLPFIIAFPSQRSTGGLLVIFYGLQYFWRKRKTIGTSLSYKNKILIFTLQLATITRWSPNCGSNTPPKISYSEWVWQQKEHFMHGMMHHWFETSLWRMLASVLVTLWHMALMRVMLWVALGRGVHVRTKCTASVPGSNSERDPPHPLTRTSWDQHLGHSKPSHLQPWATWEFKFALWCKVWGNLEDSDR